MRFLLADGIDGVAAFRAALTTSKLFLMVCLIAGSPGVWAQSQDANAALLAADQAFAGLSEREGPKVAFAAYLHPEAMQMPAGGHVVMGLPAIVKGFDGLPPGFQLLWQPQHAEVAQSGELGWSWGIYQSRFPDPNTGETREGHGKYLNVWRKVEGVWKVLVDLGNASPGPWPPVSASEKVPE